VPLAERAGTVALLTNWVIRTALRQMQKWSALGVEPDVSINLSAMDLLDPELESSIMHHSRAFGVRPQRIELEITESAVMRETAAVIATMERLRRHGFRFAIDDFGTGYSSLSYLRGFPFDKLKIDRAFVHGIEHNGDQRRLLKGIVELAHALDLSTVAEGAETAGEVELLTEMQVDQIQGYFFCKPAAAPEAMKAARTLDRGLLNLPTSGQVA